MTEPWRTEGGSSEGNVTIILPDGSEKQVPRTSSFAQTVRDIARDAGLSKFSVHVDGSEIESSEAPTNFAGIDEVELVKYDEGA